MDVNGDGSLKVGHLHPKRFPVAIPELAEMALCFLPSVHRFPGQEEEASKVLETSQDPILQEENGPRTKDQQQHSFCEVA